MSYPSSPKAYSSEILRDDEYIYRNDHRLFALYGRLREAYFQEGYHSEGDFSERLSVLLAQVGERISAYRQPDRLIGLNNAQVTEALYRHAIADVRNALIEYLKYKDGVWILIDNIDKGWPSNGLTEGDVAIVRCLIEGVDKLRRHLSGVGAGPCNPIIFLRSDVYERLIVGTADRGKISVVSVDWNDRGLMKQMLRLRFVHSGLGDELTFDQMWSRIACTHVAGKFSDEFILDRCLMRPRALLDIFVASKGYAINRQHDKIQEDDFLDGLKDYSHELVENIGLEIRDVAPDIECALYMFIDRSPTMNKTELFKIMKSNKINDERRTNVLDLLLWYGVLGVEVAGGGSRYIFDLNYNFRMLKALADQQAGGARFVLNPAFRQALAVSDPTQGVQSAFI